MEALIYILYTALNFYWWCVFLNVAFTMLIQFGVMNANQPLVRTVHTFLYQITEPVLRRIRNVIPGVGGFDLSPLILLVLIHALQIFLVTSVARTFA